MSYQVGSDGTFVRLDDSSGNIYTTGNIGIGTTLPSSPLYVVGDATVTGNMRVDGSMSIGVGTLTLRSTSITSSSDLILSSPTMIVDTTSGISMGGNLLSQLNGGAYFGRVGIRENQFDTTNFGSNWTARGPTSNWSKIVMSSDGKIQLAIPVYYYVSVYISYDYGKNWSSTGPSATNHWTGGSMSSDGRYQSIVQWNGPVYDSNDYGHTWIANFTGSCLDTAMSSDGRVRVVTDVYDPNVYVSIDYGVTWVIHYVSGNTVAYTAVSSDGRIQTVVSYGSYIYTSYDYGTTWTPVLYGTWERVAISSDGRVQIALPISGQIYLSLDYGHTWNTTGPSTTWKSAAMSSNGQIQIAGSDSNLYVSTDYGSTWSSVLSGQWSGTGMSSDGRVMTAALESGQLYVSYADIALDSNFLVNAKVGIGTTSPVTPLHIHGPNNALMQFTDTDSGATATSGFQVGIDANEAANLWNYENTPMFLATNNTAQVTILANGIVGIGTTSPNPYYSMQINKGPVGHANIYMTTDNTSFGVYQTFENAGSGLIFGVDRSSGGLLMSGSSGYAAVFNSTLSNPIQIGTNNTLRITIGGDGAISLSNGAYFNGFVGIGTATGASSWSSFETYKNINDFQAITVRNPNTGISAAAGFACLSDIAETYLYSFSSNSTAILAGLTTAKASVIQSGADRLIINQANNSPIYLSTNNTVKMTIDSGGNVGIGITNPASLTQIHGSATSYLQLTNTDSGATATSGFQVGIDANEAANLWNYGNTPMLLATNNVERMRVTSDGYAEFQNHIIQEGLYWRNAPLPTTHATSAVQSVCYGDGKFATLGYDGAVFSSPDGVNWTYKSSVNFYVGGNAICYANGMFVAVAVFSFNPYRIAASHDLVNWTFVASASWAELTSICYGKGLFVATTTTGFNAIFISPDGVNWSYNSVTAFNSVCYGNGLFVAVGNSGSVRTSTDGITWTIQTAPGNDWNGVCYGNGEYVAVASSGTGNRVMTSPDGVTWTSRSSASDDSWKSICYADGLFVAVATDRYTYQPIMTSPNGVNWTLRPTNLLAEYNSVCYGNGLFVCGCSYGSGTGYVAISGKKLEFEDTPSHSHDTFLHGVKITGDSSVIGNEYLSGRLGIGTTTPTAPFHVIGDSTVTGNLQVNGLYNANGTNGLTGWADDGTHFRLYFTNGIITSVTDSTAGGHS